LAELSEKAVYLCGCRGKVSQALPMDAVCRFLEARQPGLRVIVGDNFCEPRTLSALVAQHGLEPLVVGACSQLKTKLHFWEEPDRADIDPYSIGTVDVTRGLP